MTVQFKFWQRWLIVVLLAWMAFSMALVLAPGLTRQFFGLLIYASPEKLNTFGTEAVAYISLLHAVLGAVMFGWAWALLWVVMGPFKQMSSQAWLTLSVSLAMWCLPDTAYSLWSGFWHNAAFNAVFVVLLGTPLIFTYRACRGH